MINTNGLFLILLATAALATHSARLVPDDIQKPINKAQIQKLRILLIVAAALQWFCLLAVMLLPAFSRYGAVSIVLIVIAWLNALGAIVLGALVMQVIYSMQRVDITWSIHATATFLMLSGVVSLGYGAFQLAKNIDHNQCI